MRAIYNVAEEAGCDLVSPKSEETVRANVGLVKDWIDENFGDIFDTETSISSSTILMLGVYNKGTKSGFYMTQTWSAGAGSYGVFLNGTKKQKGSAELRQGLLKMFIATSKYGYIAGFFKDSTAEVGAMGVKHKGEIWAVIADGATIHCGNGAGNITECGSWRASQMSDVHLSLFLPPTDDEEFEGIYRNDGAAVGECREFAIGTGSEKYIALPVTSGYVQPVLKM